MTERFEQLQKSSECLYTIGSPLVIAATALLKDTQTGEILAQVKFQNIGNQKIVAVFADFEAKDISGDALNGVINFQFLDLNAKRNEYFGSKTAANIPDGRTRQIVINIKRVVFADKTAWDAPANAIWSPIVMHPLAETFENVDLIEQYRRETIAKAKYTPEDVLDLWVCTCGAY